MIRAAWAPLAELLSAGLEDLAVLHWEEVEIDTKDIPLALDVATALAGEKRGQHKTAGLWVNGEFVGYAAFIIQTALFHRATLHAFCSAIYVDPEHRGLASYYFLRWIPNALAELGVKKAYMASKPMVHLGSGKTSATLGTVLGGLGWKLSEEMWCILPGGDNERRHGSNGVHAS